MTTRYLWPSAVTCIPRTSGDSRGIFVGDNPLTFSTPIFMLQITISSFMTGLMTFLLKPLGHCSFFSNMLGILIAGPQILGRWPKYDEYVYSTQSLQVLETVQYFGVINYFFVLGLKLDFSILMRVGKKGCVIGILNFTLPLLLTLPVAYILKYHSSVDPDVGNMLPYVAGLQSITSFHVIVAILADLKLLNSEIGRLGMASSLVSGFCSTILWFVGIGIQESSHGTLQYTAIRLIEFIIMVITVVCVMRPIIVFITRHTPEGHPIKESHISIVFILLLFCAMGGESLGQRYLSGSMLLGICVPQGNPLSSSLENKVEVFVSTILLPLHYFSCIGTANLYEVEMKTVMFVAPISLLAFLGKFISGLLPSLYFRLPFMDALSMGLLMCSQGIMDLQYLRGFKISKRIDGNVYAILIYITIISSGIIAPLLKFIYKPSRRYYSCKRRSIQQTNEGTELRIIACVYSENNTPTIINLLEASNPTQTSPIRVSAIHLIDLRGLGTPVLVAHKGPDSVYYHYSKHIMNAFKLYEMNNQGGFSVCCFTAMSPFASMHDDVCTLAIERKTSLIIIPFHRQRQSDGLIETTAPLRNVNNSILSFAPCSVGILIGRGADSSSCFVPGSRCLYRVAVLFLGGPDDRETLAYSMRMANHSNILLTVVRLLSAENKKVTSLGEKLDNEIVNDFKISYKSMQRITYVEEVVTDGEGTVKIATSLENSFDLMMVGRQHSRRLPFVRGLTLWNEFPELGYLGSILASSETENQLSVLIVQQQPVNSEDDIVVSSPKNHSNVV